MNAYKSSAVAAIVAIVWAISGCDRIHEATLKIGKRDSVNDSSSRGEAIARADILSIFDRIAEESHFTCDNTLDDNLIRTCYRGWYRSLNVYDNLDAYRIRVYQVSPEIYSTPKEFIETRDKLYNEYKKRFGSSVTHEGRK